MAKKVSRPFRKAIIAPAVVITPKMIQTKGAIATRSAYPISSA